MAQIICHLVGDSLGQDTAVETAAAIAKQVPAVGGIDAEGTDNGTVVGRAGIGVKRQSRYPQAP